MSPKTKTAIVEIIERAFQSNDAQARKTEGGYGFPVGCEGIEYRIRADTMIFLSLQIQANIPMKLAAEVAKGHARSMVHSHNARRAKDVNWQRWEGTADTAVENIERAYFQLTNNTMDDPCFSS